MLPIPPSILNSPVPTLTPSENQSVVKVALSIPELQNWSHDWKYVDMGFLGNNKLGIAGGFEWQYAIVNLKAPSSSALIPCDNDWWAWIEIDMTTMKVVQATYPTMESHQCEVAMGGGPGTSRVIVPVAESPLKQFKSGIEANDVKCEQGLQLVIKSEDNSPACVKSQTAQKLVERGWGWAMQPIDSLKSLLPNRIPGLENDTGIVTFGNRTYYFETPHYTQDAYVNPVQISFHGVVFTLFPPGFKGGLPTNFGGVAANGCSGSYFWTDAKFPDGTHVLLNIFALTTKSQQCLALPAPTYFSTHTDPLAGLTFYEGNLKLLVSVEGMLQQNNSVLSTQIPTNETIYHDFPQPHGYSIINSTQGIVVNNDAEASNLTGFSVKSPTDLPPGYKVKLIKASKEIPMVTIFVSKYPLTENTTSEDFLWNQQGILITYQQTGPHEFENKHFWGTSANNTITIAGAPAEVFGISKEYNNGYPYDMWASLLVIKDNNTSVAIDGFFNSDDLIKIATSMLEK